MFLGIYRGIIILGFLGWCRTSSIHSTLSTLKYKIHLEEIPDLAFANQTSESKSTRPNLPKQQKSKQSCQNMAFTSNTKLDFSETPHNIGGFLKSRPLKMIKILLVCRKEPKGVHNSLYFPLNQAEQSILKKRSWPNCGLYQFGTGSLETHSYCGWMKSCTKLKLWLKPWFVGIYRGIESFQGFFGGAKWTSQPSTVWAPYWKLHLRKEWHPHVPPAAGAACGPRPAARALSALTKMVDLTWGRCERVRGTNTARQRFLFSRSVSFGRTPSMHAKGPVFEKTSMSEIMI